MLLPDSIPFPGGRGGSIGPATLLIAVCAVLGASPPLLAQDNRDTAQEAGDWLDVEVVTVGVDLATGAPLALVHEEWRELLPIWIGEVEAQAIMRVLQGVETPRPMTHDLMADMLGPLGVELEEVRVHDLRDGTYFGSLVFRQEGRSEPIVVDTRPSDGIALAVRTGARIRVARRLLEGIPQVDFISSERDRPIVRIRGVTVAEPGAEDRERFGLSSRAGLVVLHAPMRLQPGDLIVAVNGTEVGDARSYLDRMIAAGSSSSLTVTVVREGEELEIPLPPPGATRIGP